MYHYTLKINILSNDFFLETELGKMVPLNHFKHEIQTYHLASQDNLSDCDVVIIDLPIDNNLKDLYSLCREDVVLVLCADSDLLSTLHQEDYGLLADVWIKPFTADFVAFQWQKLLSVQKLKKDYQLNQNYLNTAINSIPDLIWFKDIRGSHIKVNDAFCHAVGKTKQDVEGRGHYYIWDLKQEEYEKGEYVCLETEEIVLKERKTCLFDEKVMSKHGLRQFKTYKSPLFDDNQEIIGTVGIAHDVTDLENIVTELEIILRSMPFAILIKNYEDRIINANDKFELYFNIKKEEILGKDYGSWKKTALLDISEINDEGDSKATLYTNSEKRILEIHEEPIFDVFSNLVGQICICRDVTTERTLEHQILRNSNTDFMTGLYNRRYFYEYINKYRGANPLSLIYVDLDYFKKVNDTYGHQAGDEALIATAGLLNKCFSDAFISRLGGDEFLITFIGEYSLEYLKERATLLLNEMHKTFRANEQFRILTASIGIAQSDNPQVKIDTLIQQSDIALYEAKQRGRAQYCIYTPELKDNQI